MLATRQHLGDRSHWPDDFVHVVHEADGVDHTRPLHEHEHEQEEQDKEEEEDKEEDTKRTCLKSAPALEDVTSLLGCGVTLGSR